jgi:hypothetical protein
MNFEKPNLDFNYSLEEFKADVKGVKAAIRNKTFKKTPNIKIEMSTGEIKEYGFNENHPLFQQSEYFKQKYGEGTSIKYNLKFFTI